ncbi:MAG TPA: hypothetical protein VM598_05585 [Bdellovibrionota bacterium]|nr:hypothetical protein [Bdellovibrionota bacterium]
MRALVVALSLTFFGCSTLSVNHPATRTIRKVAIVGFGVEQQMPPEFSLASFGKPAEGKWGKVAGVTYGLDHAGRMYAGLAATLKKELGWKVLAAQEVARAPEYAAAFKDRTSGLQTRPILPQDYELFGVPGVLDAYSFEKLSHEERQKVISGLGVDAIAIATVSVQLERGGGIKQLVGAGDYFPRAHLRFTVFRRGEDTPAWQDFRAMGEAVSQGTEHVLGITDGARLNEQVVGAGGDACRKLLERYRNAEG